MCLSPLSVSGQHRLTSAAVTNPLTSCHQEQLNSTSSKSWLYIPFLWVHLLFLIGAETEIVVLYRAAVTKMSKLAVALNLCIATYKHIYSFYIKWILKIKQKVLKEDTFCKCIDVLAILDIFSENSGRIFMQVLSSRGFYPVNAVSLEGQKVDILKMTASCVLFYVFSSSL